MQQNGSVLSEQTISKANNNTPISMRPQVVKITALKDRIICYSCDSSSVANLVIVAQPVASTESFAVNGVAANKSKEGDTNSSQASEDKRCRKSSMVCLY